MPLNINLQQILLHALNFVILFGAMYFLLYKPVKSFMDSRKAHYEKMDEDAKAVLAEAEKTKAAMKRSSRAPTRRSRAASARRTKPCSTRWTSAARRPSSRRARSCARRGKMPRASMSA